MSLFGSTNLDERAKKMTDCDFVMKKFVMEQYVIYKYRAGIAFLIATFGLPALMNYYKIKNGSQYRTYLFFFLTWYLTQWVISKVVERLISQDALHKMLVRCKGWQEDTDTKASCKAVVDTEKVQAYLKEEFNVREADYESPVPLPYSHCENFVSSHNDEDIVDGEIEDRV
jgi:hypothetical protein